MATTCAPSCAILRDKTRNVQRQIALAQPQKTLDIGSDQLSVRPVVFVTEEVVPPGSNLIPDLYRFAIQCFDGLFVCHAKILLSFCNANDIERQTSKSFNHAV